MNYQQRHLVKNLPFSFLIALVIISCQRDELKRTPKVETMEISEVMATSAVVTADIIDLGSGIDDHGSCFGLTEHPVISVLSTSLGSISQTGLFTSNLSDLVPGQSYYVRAYVISGDLIFYGTDRQFSTPSGLADIITSDVTNITTNSATSGGTVATGNGESITARGLCWDYVSTVNMAKKKGFTLNGSGEGIFAADITGLSSGKTYYVKAWAITKIDTSYGEPKVFTTIGPPATLSTTAVSSVTTTSAISGGNITIDGSVQVLSRGVCWGTGHNPTISDNKTTDGSGTGVFTSTITGLSSGTLYYVRAYATGIGRTDYGTEISFSTLSSGTAAYDNDGNGYNSVKIGTQTWLTGNLRTTTYLNGDAISNVTNNTAWSGLSSGAYCWYNNDVSNKGLYGAMYNYYALTDSRKICPAGWHVPTDPEWTTLTTYLSSNGYGSNGVTANIAKSIAAASGWEIYDQGTENISYNQATNNSSGFSGTPGGYRTESGIFGNLKFDALWWAATSNGLTDRWLRSISYYRPDVMRISLPQGSGLSVRCLKDETVQGVLATVSTTAVTNISSAQALSGGTIVSNGGVQVTASGLCWSSLHTPTTADSFVSNTDGTATFTSWMTGLSANVTYKVRAYATNSAGTAYGTELTFTTLSSTAGSVTDIEGNSYKTIAIGSQVWMAENLKTTKYNDNTAIPLITVGSAWAALSTPGYCWYNNDLTNNKGVYGALYNWFAVNTGKLCPTGWHIPSDTEIGTLSAYLGGECSAGGKLKEPGNSHWMSPNTGATNEAGFNALPSGLRSATYGDFIELGSATYWWSATPDNATASKCAILSHDSSCFLRSSAYAGIGFSVRCIKN